jgi:glycosyltransferase involved in cell wall biosynthesis
VRVTDHHLTTILHVVFSLSPGGMENGLINVANALDPEQFRTHVCCLDQAGEFARRLTPAATIHVLDKPAGFSWTAVRRLSALMKQVRPHLLHTHNLGPLIYSGLASSWGRRCPILHGEHSLLSPADLRPKRLWQRKIFYRACRRIHTVSQDSAQQLISLGLPKEKIMVIPNGVDTEKFAPGDRTAARAKVDSIPENAFVIGIVGRFGPYKRHADLIEAFTQVAAHWPEAHLLVVGGGGPEEATVRRLAELSPIAGRIHFTGFQNDPRPWYHAMDLLVVPSVNEGMANAVLEAMACGLPVLAHDICGNSEMLTHGVDGLIEDLGTPAKLATHLEAALRRATELPTLGAAARKTATTRFALADMVENYAQHYKKLACPH